MTNLKIPGRLRMHQEIVMHVRRTLNGFDKQNIAVRVGTEVHPEDVLATGQAAGGFRTVHLASMLGVDPKEALTFLKTKMGDRIFQGEMLAQREAMFGFSKKLILAPTDGIIDFYDEVRGELKIKLVPQNLKLVAGMYGVVDKVDPTTGEILIKCQAKVVYGVIGCGKERGGLIRILNQNESFISSKQIDNLMHGQILVGGGMVFIDAVEKAISLHVEGLVSGGINATDYKTMVGGRWNIHNKKWSDVGVSLIITEGFGSLPLDDELLEVLKSHEGKFAIMDGNRARIILPSNNQNSMMYIRKTQLPQGSYVESEPVRQIVDLKAGLKVRITQGNMVGICGVVEAIDQTATLLPSGLSSNLVTVSTKKQKVKVPIHNLETEIIG